MSEILAVVSTLDADWQSFKVFLEQSIGFSHDALHVMVGVMVQLAAAAVLRMSIARPWPWLVVLVLELANELNDLRFGQFPDLATRYGEGAKDLLLTIALPTLLLVLARKWPGLLTGRANEKGAADAAPSHLPD